MATLRRLRGRARLALSLRRLPAGVGRFLWRADRLARRSGDAFSLASAARPTELGLLISLARGRAAIVELGTGTAWSAIALALGDPARRVISFDPVVRAERERYLALVAPAVRARIELRGELDSEGPHEHDPPVELLFIDSLHEREPVKAAFHAWREALAPGALVVFHDYAHPQYPGVREAVAELALRGSQAVGMFVWRAP